MVSHAFALGAIEEAQSEIEGKLDLLPGMFVDWKGEFESQQRAMKRLSQVTPVVITLIFIILLTTFNRVKDALMVMANVPFALIGGVARLYFAGINFSISAGVGFIALSGICIQNGVILLSQFKENLARRMSLDEAIDSGVNMRIRPVLMTALTSFIGLIPASLSTGIGSESQKPLAIVIVCGIVSATALTLWVFPVMFRWAYRRES